MISINDLNKELNNFKLENLQNYLKPYQGQEGTGFVAKVTIPEVLNFPTERLITFDNIDEIKEFLYTFSSSDHQIEINDYESISPTYKIIKDNEEYTYDMAKEYENNKVLLENKKQENRYKSELTFNRYLKTIYKIYSITDDEVDDMKFELENVTEDLKDLKEAVFSRISFAYKARKQTSLDSGKFSFLEVKSFDNIEENLLFPKNIEEENEKIFSENDVLIRSVKEAESNIEAIKKKVECENIKNNIEMLYKQKEYLYSLYKLNSVQRLTLKHHEVEEKLDEIVKNYKILNNDEINREVNFEKEFNDFKHSNLILSIENLDRLKAIDLINSFSDKKIVLDKMISTDRKNMENIENRINNLDSDERLSGTQKIYKYLTEEYYKNFSQDEREALMIYNSPLNSVINFICSIDSYDILSRQELENLMKQDEYKEEYKNMLTNMTKLMQRTENKEENLDKFLNQIVKGDCIQKCIDTIKVLENMQSKIYLPEDIVLYRGIANDGKLKDDMPNIGTFMSASFDVDTAKKYYKEKTDNKLVKLHLKKGTPVTAIFPFVLLYNLEKGSYYLANDLQRENSALEVMFNMKDFNSKKINDAKIIKRFEFNNQEHRMYDLGDVVLYDYDINLNN